MAPHREHRSFFNCRPKYNDALSNHRHDTDYRRQRLVHIQAAFIFSKAAFTMSLSEYTPPRYVQCKRARLSSPRVVFPAYFSRTKPERTSPSSSARTADSDLGWSIQARLSSGEKPIAVLSQQNK